MSETWGGIGTKYVEGVVTMTLEELRVLVAASSIDDWEPVGAPTFLGRLAETGDQAGCHFEPQEHGSRATYKPDIAVSIAWGLNAGTGDFTEPWHQSFPDTSARKMLLDFFYWGALVDRHQFVAVDGFRAYLPLPRAEVRELVEEPWGQEIVGYWITRWQYDVFRIVDALEARDRASIFDHYVQMAGFEIRDLNGGSRSF